MPNNQVIAYKMSRNVSNPGANTTKKKANKAGLGALAMSFVLPHEHKPMRLPVVPAALTATFKSMTDDVFVVGTSPRRAFLCRDPAYPLFIDVAINNCGAWFEAVGSISTWTIRGSANTQLAKPVMDGYYGKSNSGTIGVKNVSDSNVCDLSPITIIDGNVACYVPPGAKFMAEIQGTVAAAGTGIEIEFGYYSLDGPRYCTLLLVADGTYFTFEGSPGASVAITGNVTDGVVPWGFVWIVQMRTTATAPNADTAPKLRFGWNTGGRMMLPIGGANVLYPFSPPPEFKHSRIPYTRTRLNASSALFTNVTAALAKEGTVLAARLKGTIVDPWNFTVADLNSVHPDMRYYGPLEKGLYTFTTPSANVEEFRDHVYNINNNGAQTDQKAMFNVKNIGTYNAMYFTDLGSDPATTQLATSCYVHSEFETTSSLFELGVSTLTLESLHAAEVALLRLGYFHENPTHWAMLAQGVANALRYVAPMVAPIVQHYGTKLLNRGVEMLKTANGKPAGDRNMTQKQMVVPRKGRRVKTNGRK